MFQKYQNTSRACAYICICVSKLNNKQFQYVYWINKSFWHVLISFVVITAKSDSCSSLIECFLHFTISLDKFIGKELNDINFEGEFLVTILHVIENFDSRNMKNRFAIFYLLVHQTYNFMIKTNAEERQSIFFLKSNVDTMKS